MTRSDSSSDFLRTAAALAALPLLPACATEPASEAATSQAPLAVTFDAQAVAQDDKAFPLAVQAGSMHADRGIFWSFVQGAPAATLRVWQAAKTPGQVLIAHESVVQAADGYLKTPVLDLAPSTLYHYAFFLGSPGALTARSAVGQVRSAFGPDVVAPLTIGMTSCTRSNFETRDEYRGKWRNSLTDPGCRALLPTVGPLQCWDDHALANDEGSRRHFHDQPQSAHSQPGPPAQPCQVPGALSGSRASGAASPTPSPASSPSSHRRPRPSQRRSRARSARSPLGCRSRFGSA